MKKRVIGMLLCIAMTAALVVGCASNKSDSESEEVKEDPRVVEIGAYGAHVPFNYMENDELVGYEVDIWKEIAKRNNLELNYTISSDVAGLFTMLDSGKIDTIL